MVTNQKYLSGIDVDTESFADALRRLAEGIEDGDVPIRSVDTKHRTVPTDPSVFELAFEYQATHGYEDVVDVIRYATDAYLRFADRYVVPILDGDKKTTIRFGLERSFEPGDQIALIDEADDVFAEAVVETTVELSVERVVEWGIGKWGDHDVDDLVDTLRGLYDDDSIDGDTVVTAVIYSGVEANTEWIEDKWGMTRDEFFDALDEAPSGEWELPTNDK